MKRFSFVIPFVLAVLGMIVVDTSPASAQTFTYRPAGELVAGSGTGRVDQTVYVPGMRFPLEKGPAFANSQVYGHGGYHGPGGGQCDSANYSYPWRDNYCETRSWSVPMCPGGKGHQGQDIRPATCKNHVHKAVAAVDGTITSTSGYVVVLRAADGTNHRYMHMSNVAVKRGQQVKRGELMGYVSNYMGTTPTTIHLHYDIQRNGQFIPTYMSLVRSYEALMGASGTPNSPQPPPAPEEPKNGGSGSGSDVVNRDSSNPIKTSHTGTACSAVGVASDSSTGGATWAGLALLGVGVMLARQRRGRG